MLSLKNIVREICLDILSIFGNLLFLFSAKPKIDPLKIKKILIVKLYALGDVVFAQPMVPNLRANFPKAKIIWLVDHYSRTVVDHTKGVDQIIEWQGFFTYRRLRAESIDLAFSLYRSPLSFLMLWLARIPIRVGFSWRGRGFALTHKVKFRGDILESDRYLKLIEDLGLAIVTRRRQLFVDKEEKEKIMRRVRDLGLNLKKRPLVGLVPGGGDNPQLLMPMKRWALDRMAGVADYLVSNKRAQVVLIGSPTEKGLADQVQSLAKEPINNLAGQTKLSELIAFLSLFDLVIAVDTGPLHLAAALGVPTIGLFGPSDPSILAQVGPKNLVIRKDPNPPTYIPTRVMIRNFAGKNSDATDRSMLYIEVKDVIQAVDRLLKDS